MGIPSYPGEDVTTFISDLVPQQSHNGYADFIGMLTHKDIPSRSGQVTVSHFIETEKNKKTENIKRNMFQMKEQELPSPPPQEEHLKKQR